MFFAAPTGMGRGQDRVQARLHLVAGLGPRAALAHSRGGMCFIVLLLLDADAGGEEHDNIAR